MGSDPLYTTDASEVFPMQTIAYYVKRSSSGTTTSLYRRVFDGDHSDGLEQELIEGVESLQLRYGVDTSTTSDGVVDRYVSAKGPLGNDTDSVTDWSTSGTQGFRGWSYGYYNKTTDADGIYQTANLTAFLNDGTNTVSALIAGRFGDASAAQLSALLTAGFVLFVITLLVNTLASIIVNRSRSGAGTDA
jgi:hypothetical protein